MKKLRAYVIMLAAILSLMLINAHAAGSQKLCVEYKTDGYALCDASFFLYNIGTLSGTEVIPNDMFSRYHADYDISDAEKMTNLALTLSGYILRDDISPLCNGVTDSTGKTDFDGTYLPEGVYILMADKHHQNNTVFFCEPTLIVLPHGEGDILNINVKYEAVPDNTQNVITAQKVLKAWKNDSDAERPVQIEVQLLKDGEIFDTVTLSESNSWRHQWNELAVFSHWTVVEKQVSKDYTVTLSKSGKTFLLTNCGNACNNETPLPDESTTATTSNNNSSENTTQPSQEDETPELPVTGSLQWLVPYLACIGLALLILGYAKYRKSELADE